MYQRDNASSHLNNPRSSRLPVGTDGFTGPPVPVVDWHAERILVARVLAGDPTAERTFYDLHVTAVYHLAVRVTRDPDLARDCTQETFIRAFGHLTHFRGDGPVSAWLRTVTLSVVRNMWRKEVSWRNHTVALDDIEAVVAPDDPEAVDQHDQLRHALALLSHAHRQMLLLYYGRGYTHPELAVRLGISVTASKSRLLRARVQLRHLLIPGHDRPDTVSMSSHPHSSEAGVVWL